MAIRANARPGARRRTVTGSASRPRPQAPRTGAKRTILYYFGLFPAFMRLFGGLLTDKRVSGTDKLIVAGAVAYVVSPVSLIPDFIPLIGEIDDLFILVLALKRLISHAGREVVEDHWTGDPDDLSATNLRLVLLAAAFFLPRRVRRKLKVIGKI